MPSLPNLVVTGASGFIGRHLVNALQDRFNVFALGRRSSQVLGPSMHPNVRWRRLDIAVPDSVDAVAREIAEAGGAEFVFHLAGYYDFTNEPHPEYHRTNVLGTKYILELARKTNVKRFVYTSSLTVSDFPKPGSVIAESSPADAAFPYADSKREAEKWVRQYSAQFPCAIVRPAAVFSDWCEYHPLYYFLATWLSSSWKRRILGGRGESAIPYLHVNDMVRFFLQIMEQHPNLGTCDTLIASPDGCTAHKVLYAIAGSYFFSKPLPPIYLPKFASLPGLILLDLAGRLIGRRPFERPWMLAYLDRKLAVDTSLTRHLLHWAPTPRYHIKRRLLFLIENMKTHPNQWKKRNEETAHEKAPDRPNFRIYQHMVDLKDQILEEHVADIIGGECDGTYPSYRSMDAAKLKNRASMIYHLLETAVRLGDRTLALQYAQTLAKERHSEGYFCEELTQAVSSMGAVTVKTLTAQPGLKGMEQRIHDLVMLTIQLLVDQIEETYDQLRREPRKTTSTSR